MAAKAESSKAESSRRSAPTAEPRHPTREPGSIRLALNGLTTRGRCFLAAGLTAVLCSYLLGQFALLQVGLLLTALPVGSVAMLVRTRYRVASGRSLSPARTPAGQEARVNLRVDNVSRVPTGLLMLEDRVPYVLGPRPRFVLDRVEPRGFREVSYRVRSDLRGRYPLGPLQLRLGDPFGLCELSRAFTTHDLLTVVPQVQTLAPVKLLGEWTGFGDSHARAVALAGEDDVVPREYRHGDDLRRVHWRSTAKYGELMVRREEQPLRHHATVLLDTRDRGHRGSGPASSFEWAVSAAASVALHLLERGYEVRLLTDTGEQATASGAFSSAASGALTDGTTEAAGLLLDQLAMVELSDGNGLSRAEDVLRLGGEGLLVAILGALDDEQLAELSRLRRRTGSAVALLLDTDSWTLLRGIGGTGGPGAATRANGNGPGGEDGNGAARANGDGDPAPDRDTHRERHERLLRQAGWRVLPAASGDSLPELWRLLARGSGAGPRHATAATTATTSATTTDGGS